MAKNKGESRFGRSGHTSHRHDEHDTTYIPMPYKRHGKGKNAHHPVAPPHPGGHGVSGHKRERRHFPKRTAAAVSILAIGIFAAKCSGQTLQAIFESPDSSNSPNNPNSQPTTPSTAKNVGGCVLRIRSNESVFGRLNDLGIDSFSGKVNDQGWHIGSAAEYQLQFPKDTVYTGDIRVVQKGTYMLVAPVVASVCTKPQVHGTPQAMPNFIR